MHSLRQTYGWTDPQILWHIRTYGQPWIDETTELLNETRKRELEEEVERRRWQVYVTPLARTPMSNKGAQSTNRLQKQLLSALDDLLPWRKDEQRAHIRERLKRPPKSETRVIPDG